jgi:hypothetical protein
MSGIITTTRASDIASLQPLLIHDETIFVALHPASIMQIIKTRSRFFIEVVV